ncbi:hypothetical protein, partial [Pseudoclavibacter helvolus]
MPNVTFTLKTFGLSPTRDIRANVIFTPSRQGAIGPDGVLVRRVVVPWNEIDPVTGKGTANLANTTDLRPPCHFIMSIDWIDGSPQGWAEIQYPLHVNALGGDVSELLDMPLSPANVRVQLEHPRLSDPTYRGWWL